MSRACNLNMENEKLFNLMSQFAMPGLTIMAQAAIALKFPEWDGKRKIV